MLELSLTVRREGDRFHRRRDVEMQEHRSDAGFPSIHWLRRYSSPSDYSMREEGRRAWAAAYLPLYSAHARSGRGAESGERTGPDRTEALCMQLSGGEPRRADIHRCYFCVCIYVHIYVRRRYAKSIYHLRFPSPPRPSFQTENGCDVLSSYRLRLVGPGQAGPGQASSSAVSFRLVSYRFADSQQKPSHHYLPI